MMTWAYPSNEEKRKYVLRFVVTCKTTKYKNSLKENKKNYFHIFFLLKAYIFYAFLRQKKDKSHKIFIYFKIGF